MPERASRRWPTSSISGIADGMSIARVQTSKYSKTDCLGKSLPTVRSTCPTHAYAHVNMHGYTHVNTHARTSTHTAWQPLSTSLRSEPPMAEPRIRSFRSHADRVSASASPTACLYRHRRRHAYIGIADGTSRAADSRFLGAMPTAEAAGAACARNRRWIALRNGTGLLGARRRHAPRRFFFGKEVALHRARWPRASGR